MEEKWMRKRMNGGEGTGKGVRERRKARGGRRRV